MKTFGEKFPSMEREISAEKNLEENSAWMAEFGKEDFSWMEVE